MKSQIVLYFFFCSFFVLFDGIRVAAQSGSDPLLQTLQTGVIQEGIKSIFQHLNSGGQKDGNLEKHLEAITTILDQGFRDLRRQEDHKLTRLSEIQTNIQAVWEDFQKIEKCKDTNEIQIHIDNFVESFVKSNLFKDINFVRFAVIQSENGSFGSKPLLDSMRDTSRCQTEKLTEYKDTYLKLYKICSLCRAAYLHFTGKDVTETSTSVKRNFEDERYMEIEAAFSIVIEKCKTEEQIKKYLTENLSVAENPINYGREISKGYPHIWVIVTFLNRSENIQLLHCTKGSLIHSKNKIVVYGMKNNNTLDENDQLSVKQLVKATIKETKCASSNFSACCSEDVEKALQNNGFKARSLVAFIHDNTDSVNEFNEAGKPEYDF